MPGYSSTPLAQKLGYKAGYSVRLIHPPDKYLEWLEPVPERLSFVGKGGSHVDLVHVFATSKSDLEKELPALMKQISAKGMIWVSWPKKTSGVRSDITEDTIREVCLPLGLVDTKVCAVTDIWSGLKLVIRKEKRVTVKTAQAV